MGLPCRFVFTFNQLLGIILASVGFGILIGKLMPWWGYIIAFIILIVGLILIFSS